MKFSLASENLLSTVKNRADLLIVLVQNGHAGFASGKTGVQAALNQAAKAGHLATEKGKTLALYQASGWAAPKVLSG